MGDCKRQMMNNSFICDLESLFILSLTMGESVFEIHFQTK